MSWRDRKTIVNGLVDFDQAAIERCIAEMKAIGFVPDQVDCPVRFSSQKQEEGSSESRQIGNITEIVNRIKAGVQPRWIMECSADGKMRAISGFKYDGKTGKPVVFDENKALGAYIKKAKDGNIPAGTLVVVDEYDRWARAKPDDAFESVMTLLRGGVHFLVLHPKPLYMAPGDKDNTAKRSELGNMIERAHAFSASIQKKVKASYTDRIRYILETGKKAPLGGCAPHWLKWDATIEDYKPDPARWVSVEKLVSEFLANTPIARLPAILNDSGAMTLRGATKWSEASVREVLKNPALAGTLYLYGGKYNISDYYPRVVTPDQWDIIQARFASRHRPGGARDNTITRNLWPGRIFCAHCGEPMYGRSFKQSDVLGWLNCRSFCHHGSEPGKPYCRQPRPVLRDAIELHFFTLLLQKSPMELLRPKSELSRDAEIAKKQSEIAKAQAATEDYKSTFYDPQADAEQKGRFKAGFAELQAVERKLKSELAELVKTSTPIDSSVIRGIAEAIKLVTGQDIISLPTPALVNFALSTEDLMEQLRDPKIRLAALNALRMVVCRIEVNVQESAQTKRHIKTRLEQGDYTASYRVQWMGGIWTEPFDLTEVSLHLARLYTNYEHHYTESNRAAVSARMKGRPQSVESRRKRSESMKRWHATRKAQGLRSAA